MNTWGSEERGADARQAWRDINKNPDMLTAYNKSNQAGMNRSKFNLWQSEYWANNLDF